MVQPEVVPYYKEDPYIFVSYSRLNDASALSFIQSLENNGLRVWYDGRIPPGTDWDECVAYHIKHCTFFIALLSEEYFRSKICKDELKYASGLEKSMLLVYLDNSQLPDALQMRLGRSQAIRQPEYTDEKKFYQKLFTAQGIAICRSSAPQKNSSKTSQPHRKQNISVTQNGYAKFNNPKAPYHLIFVVSTSGSMTGIRIAEVTKGIQQAAASLTTKFHSNLAIDILQYDTLPKWRTLDDLPLRTAGLANMGQALSALQPYGNILSKKHHCAVVFISDGTSTDAFDEPLRLLKQERWFKKAIRTGVAIDSDASHEMLANITKSPYAVTSTEDTSSLSTLLEMVSVASVKALVHNSRCKTNITGRNIIDWLDHENIDETLKWSISPKGTLIIQSGAIIPNFISPKVQPPWDSHRNTIKRIILESGVRSIGSYAFSNLPNLEKVVIPASVTQIMNHAFAFCPQLTEVHFIGQVFYLSKISQKNTAPAKHTIICPKAFTDTPWKQNGQRLKH